MMNDYNHAHTPDSMRCPCTYAMQNANSCISCYMYNEHYMEQFINRTSCQVPWIIISKTYNLHPFMLIYITHIYQHIYNTFNMLFNFQQQHKKKQSTQTSHSWPYSALEIIWTQSRNLSFCSVLFIYLFIYFYQLSRLSLTVINSSIKQS